MWTVPVLEITVEERAELERRVRAHTSSQRAVKRAQVVLLAAEGVANRRDGGDGPALCGGVATSVRD